MRVLVTGASGFIGRYCVQVLQERGWEIHAVARRRVDAGVGPIRWHTHDFLKPAATSRLLADIQPTHLLHLAWYTTPKAYWTAPENMQWVSTSLDLLRAFAEHGGTRSVMAGSCAEYEWTHELYSERDTPCRPASLYGACKHGLDVIASRFAAQVGLSYAWARIFFLYGPNEHPARLVASVARPLLNGEQARCSPGTQARDFLHVEDAARALVQLLVSGTQGAVNIASGQAVAVRELASRIGDLLGRRDLIDFGALPGPTNEPPVIRADVRRLTQEVGWYPLYNLDSGLRQTVEWWKNVVGNRNG